MCVECDDVVQNTARAAKMSVTSLFLDAKSGISQRQSSFAVFDEFIWNVCGIK